MSTTAYRFVGPPLPGEMRYPAEYAEVGRNLRHHSVVRSALTAFLITAASAAVGTYFDGSREGRSPALLLIAGLFALFALLCSAYFSWQSARARHAYSRLLAYAERGGAYPDIRVARWSWEVVTRPVCDPLNWLLLSFIIPAAIIVYSNAEIHEADRAASATSPGDTSAEGNVLDSPRYHWQMLSAESSPERRSDHRVVDDYFRRANDMLERGWQPVREVQVRPGVVFFLMKHGGPDAPDPPAPPSPMSNDAES